MRIIRRAAAVAAIAAGSLGAQSPARVSLVPNYQPDSHLFYAVTIHADIGPQSTLDTDAEVDMHILPGASLGNFEAELRFTRFHTVVKADAASQAALSAQVADTDKKAVSMAPVHVRSTTGALTLVSRAAGADYDQPVEMLEELARTDELPSGPASVGNQWTRQRSEPIPQVNFSLALTLECTLKALDARTATLQVHSFGSSPLPPGSLPGSDQMAAQGLVAEPTVSYDTDATVQYRVPDAVLEQTNATTHNHMQIRYVGPSPDAHTSEIAINSTSTVKLEKIVPGKS
ncbi:MAG TPA: hypothetical protein VN515_04440 [Terriglobales bacterium]|nr:hypothetical protein [Terriglobales bacterium]